MTTRQVYKTSKKKISLINNWLITLFHDPHPNSPYFFLCSDLRSPFFFMAVKEESKIHSEAKGYCEHSILECAAMSFFFSPLRLFKQAKKSKQQFSSI